MAARLLADLQEMYRVTVLSSASVPGGYLNPKWRVSTNEGELFVKQYSPERFNHAQLEKMEESLQRQAAIEHEDVPGPRLWCVNGRVIRRLDAETAYMVMDFYPGQTENAASVSLPQMKSLGEGVGRLHTALARLPKPAEPKLPRFGGYTWAALRAHLAEHPHAVASAFADTLDEGFFGRFSQGWAHEDLQSGNILFDGDKLSAIVDYDRCAWSFPAHDVGRVLLSFALADGVLDTAKVRAFCEGYALYLPMPDVMNTLRLTFCIEAVWWLRPEFTRADCPPVPKRFYKEMQWLAAHGDCLREA